MICIMNGLVEEPWFFICRNSYNSLWFWLARLRHVVPQITAQIQREHITITTVHSQGLWQWQFIHSHMLHGAGITMNNQHLPQNHLGPVRSIYQHHGSHMGYPSMQLPNGNFSPRSHAGQRRSVPSHLLDFALLRHVLLHIPCGKGWGIRPAEFGILIKPQQTGLDRTLQWKSPCLIGKSWCQIWLPEGTLREKIMNQKFNYFSVQLFKLNMSRYHV